MNSPPIQPIQNQPGVVVHPEPCPFMLKAQEPESGISHPQPRIPVGEFPIHSYGTLRALPPRLAAIDQEDVMSAGAREILRFFRREASGIHHDAAVVEGEFVTRKVLVLPPVRRAGARRSPAPNSASLPREGFAPPRSRGGAESTPFHPSFRTAPSRSRRGTNREGYRICPQGISRQGC